MKTAPDLLTEVADTLAERGKAYDQPLGERSMKKTVRVFNIITGNELTESEGWEFLLCLKQVRAFSGAKLHEDSLLDAIAYAALLAESAP